ncbi:LuxR C-terminal-related transcriptional regulator [bacterium]|nr:LuxR C-terminal-related transcriptional regulator [bacterium]
MSEPLILTKLYIPPPRSNFVHRSHLIERLNESLALGHKLTLLTASAGFGKTSLLSEWLPIFGRSAAWISLDKGDNDPVRFLVYLVAAFQTVIPNFGEGVLNSLQSPQKPSTESILTTLINNFAAIPDHVILVLDDYHLIDTKPVDATMSVDEALTFLLEHMPPQIHLVIATREDPPLPIARYRARGKLTELRAADLRFTPTEAAEFLNQVMGLSLSAEDVAALENRTEGWITGIQLAAISLKGHPDAGGFIQSFTGSHHFVLDYLVEEVLQRQPEHIRNFLLETAILDRFCAPLCNAVTKREDSKEMLDNLDRNNLFLIPLDNERQWYRYHHLFSDVLLSHLMEAKPDQVAPLHQRASAWHESYGLRSDAIRHALAAKDFERSSELIELAWSVMDINYQSSIWLSWVKALPDNLVRARPVLSMCYAWGLLDAGEMEASEIRLRDAERWIGVAAENTVVSDIEQFRSLPASIATARAYRSLALGDISATVKYAKQALEVAPEDDRVRRIQATSLLGLAQYANGDLEAAERSLADFHTNLQKTGEIQTLVGITFLLADIRVALGRLHEAKNSYEQTLRLAISQGEPLPLGTVDLYRGLSELYIEWNDLEVAEQHLLTSKKLGEQTSLTGWAHRLYVSQARLKEARGDLDGALALLDEADRVHIRSPLPEVRPVAALKARIWLKQGGFSKALSWMREQGLTVNNDLSYTREFEHITLARVLIAAGKNDQEADTLDDAVRLLERLMEAAENDSRLGSLIQVLVLQAITYQEQKKLPSALAALERALVLAKPEGYIRIFVDEGEAIRSLIEKLSLNEDRPLVEYKAKLLAAFKQTTTTPKSEMVESLSERELEVLKLIRSELTGPEIAQQLIVSINTLRTHTKNIYNKLGVNNRLSAIRRAEELDLF